MNASPQGSHRVFVYRKPKINTAQTTTAQAMAEHRQSRRGQPIRTHTYPTRGQHHRTAFENRPQQGKHFFLQTSVSQGSSMLRHSEAKQSTHFPCALSPESMTASAPSYTALVTSLTSALQRTNHAEYPPTAERKKKSAHGG